MNCTLDNSGVAVTAFFSDENVSGIFLPLLRRLTALRQRKGGRVLALLAAPPGAGKSTLAALLQRLSRTEPGLCPLTALGMDGFHRPNAWLRSHEVLRGGRPVPMTDIKGAPETFDLDALRRAVARAAAGEECGWPAYDRALHEPVEDALRVEGDVVLIEGNYLLLDEPGWRELRGFADYSMFIAADPALLRRRLLARHLAGGKSPQAAEDIVDRSDMANIRLCLERSAKADLRLELREDNTFLEA